MGMRVGHIDDNPGTGQAHISRTTSYLPFGAVEAESPPHSTTYLDEMHLFAGKELENGVGAYSIGSRWMNPRLGRWLSPDLTYLALDEKTAFSTEASNVYEYVVSNPFKLLDPDGSQAVSATEKRRVIERTLRRHSNASHTERLKVMLDMARKNVANTGDRIKCSDIGSLAIGYMTGRYPPDRWVIFREKLPSTIWKETRVYFDARSPTVLRTTPFNMRPHNRSLVWGYRDYAANDSLRDRFGTLPRFQRRGDMQQGRMWRMPIGYQLSASGPGEYIAEVARRQPTAMFAVSLASRHYGSVVSDPEHAGRFVYFDQYMVVGNLTAAGLTKRLAERSRTVDGWKEPFIGIGVIVPRSGSQEAQNAR